MSESKNTMNILMDLVFDHKQDISEQNYINICNKLKRDFENEGKIKSSICKRLDKLHDDFEILLKEHNNILKPNINNAIKYTAAYLLANKHKLITETIRVDLLSLDEFTCYAEKPVKCSLCTIRKIDDMYINTFFTCLHADYDYQKRSITPTKDVNKIIDKVLKYTKNIIKYY